MTKKKKKTKVKRPIGRKKAKSKPKKSKFVKGKKVIKKNALKLEKVSKKEPAVKEEGALIGKVTHYFPHVKAGAILIQRSQLSLGDVIRIKGHTTDFKQKIASLQIDRNDIDKASKGQEIGILVKSRVRIHDKVYKI